jgi:hypothetical protein
MKNLTKLINDKDLVCSAGWINGFKLHHNISCGKVSGEPRAVNCGTTAEWLNNVWPKVHESCSDSDIFHTDETGIFFRLTPNKTLKFKAEIRANGKLSKYQITIFLCSNSNVIEKRKSFLLKNKKILDVSRM